MQCDWILAEKHCISWAEDRAAAEGRQGGGLELIVDSKRHGARRWRAAPLVLVTGRASVPASPDLGREFGLAGTLALPAAVGLPAGAGQFLVVGDVDDLELLGVEGRVGAEGELAEVAFLHLDEVLLILGAEAFEDGGMDDDAQLEVGLVAGAAS